MSNKIKFKSADDEIDHLRMKKMLTDEEFDRLDTLMADKIDAITDSLIAEPETGSTMDEFKRVQKSMSKLKRILK
jgi:hypothetical protein